MRRSRDLLCLAVCLLVCLATCAACGSVEYSRSIYCEPSAEAPTAQAACAAALKQLGFFYAPTAAQRLTVSIEDCAPGVGGEAKSISPTVIHLCREALVEGTERWVVKHEVGHLVGLHGHLSCESGGVMSPNWSCASALDPDYAYTSADLNAIFAAMDVDR